jgi:small subunit ribosomal protein S17
MEKTKTKKQMTGKVVSNKMDKTVVVAVSTYKKNEKYQKFQKTVHNFKARDDSGELKMGDVVTIEETRPISKDIHHMVVK